MPPRSGHPMDIKLHYTEHGSGDPLILLHGNGEDGTYFVRQIDHFKDRYRVIAVESRGHGGSPRGTAPFTLDQFAQDLADFMGQLGIASAHILGFSDGSNIALLFALAHPERARSLVLNGGHPTVFAVAAVIALAGAVAAALAHRKMDGD